MTDKKKIDPKKRAIAIQYDPKDVSPKVVAKGKGHVADRIIERAKDSDVKIYKDAELVKEFESIDLGEHIPPQLYEAVAKVLIFITDLDKRYEKFNYK